MVNTDPVGDFLIRIKNGGYAHKTSVSAPYSRINFEVANILKTKGFVADVKKEGAGVTNKKIEVVLLYENDGTPRIRDVERVSKPSRRLYEKSKNIKRYKKGYGMTVFSTPKGLFADADAKKGNLGGEVLFNIW